MDRSTRRLRMMELLERKRRECLSYRTLEEETGISRHTLAAWSSRLQRERVAPKRPRSPFVELVASDGAAEVEVEIEAEDETAIEIATGSFVLRVRRGFDESTLSRVLALVSRQC